MGSSIRRALLLGVAAALLSSGIAVAGNGTTVTRFALSFHPYGDPSGPVIDCTGNRMVKPGPNGWIKDTETCVTLFHYGTPGEPFRIVPYTGDNWGANLWFSDYEGMVWAGPYTTPPCDADLLGFTGACYRAAISGSVDIAYDAQTGLYTVNIVAYYAP